VLTRAQKEQQVEELRERFGRATSVIVADYRGLDVKSVQDLRQKLRADANEYRVAKNTLLRRAVQGTELEVLADRFRGPTAVAISFGDPVGLAKALVDYAKDHEAFEIQGGYLDGKALDTGEIGKLATLPTLEQLRGKLVGLIQAPATKIAGVLQAPAGQLARVMTARKDQLGSDGG
jgi:large subunit ribosomal protein L10